MAEANPGEGRRAGAGLLLAQRLQGLNLEERTNRLAGFTPGKLLYDEALSATQVTLVKDDETDLDIVKKVIRKEKLLTQDNWMYAQRECGIHEQMNHSNIVKLYDQHETETEYQMYMEYCDKADSLTDKIREVRPRHQGFFHSLSTIIFSLIARLMK